MYYFKTNQLPIVIAFLCIITNSISIAQNITTTFDFERLTNQSPTNEKITSTIVRKDKSNTQINVKFDNSSSINPYTFDIDYNIIKDNDEYDVDMIALIDPMLTRHDKFKTQLLFTGDKIHYNLSNLSDKENQNLYGTFSLKLNENITITHKISLLNRIFVRTEKMIINKVEYLIYVFQTNYSCISKSNNKIIRKTEEKLIDYFNPLLGIIRIDRTDQKDNQNIISIK